MISRSGTLIMFHSLKKPDVLVITLAAAGILMITMGVRQSLGLFVNPLMLSTGLGITTISLALAVGQFAWGAIQPIAGGLADRFGPQAVLIGGLVVMAIGSAITPFMTSGFGLVVSLGLLTAIGSGAGSFSVFRGREFFGVDRCGCPAAAGCGARIGSRSDQCRWLVRSVRVCADPAKADSDDGLDGDDVDNGADNVGGLAAGGSLDEAIGSAR